MLLLPVTPSIETAPRWHRSSRTRRDRVVDSDGPTSLVDDAQTEARVAVGLNVWALHVPVRELGS